MEYTYKLTNSISGFILRSDGSWIPPVLDNTDYQIYLKWLDEGNTPEPASE